MSLLLHRKAAIFFTVVIVLGASTGAAAYWATSGSGSGDAAAGTSESVTITQTSTPSGLYPGGPAAALAGAFDNTNDGPVVVRSVSAAVSSITRTAVAIAAGLPCTVGEYQLNGFPVTVGTAIPSGTGVGSWTGGSIQLLDSGANQDGCKGATVNLAYTSD
jgi:hypothetical protein